VSKIAFVADVHCANHARWGGSAQSGINRRCRLILDALLAATDAARKAGCEAFVVLGDLFDTMRPEPQVIAAVRDALLNFNGPVFLLVGNHDQASTSLGDHALGPLAVEGITVVENPMPYRVGDVLLSLVPFRPGDAREWLRAAVPPVPFPSKHRVLGIHLGVIDEKTPPWLFGALDAIPLMELARAATDYDVVVAGNWHARKEWKISEGQHVMQVGTLAPTGFDNPGPEGYGTLAIYDSERGLSWQEIPGPRFVARDEVAKVAPGCTVFARVRAAPDDMPSAMAWLTEAKESGGVTDGEVQADKGESEAAARSAASAAGTASTLDEAVTRFVNAMELPMVDGHRDAVLERVRGYLKEAM